ncbi:unnamed protein product [Clavelina lepadiformis]|uniref:Uncharacterized protein n=1 Tax=Clavelina lepadiformis TaxID=159417 RepID=A0ABP0G5Z1_CLALP
MVTTSEIKPTLQSMADGLMKRCAKAAQRSDLAEDWSENAIASGRQQSHHQSRDGLELSSQNQRHLCHDFKGGSFGRSFSSAMDVFEILIQEEEIFEILQKQKGQIL